MEGEKEKTGTKNDGTRRYISYKHDVYTAERRRGGLEFCSTKCVAAAKRHDNTRHTHTSSSTWPANSDDARIISFSWRKEKETCRDP